MAPGESQLQRPPVQRGMYVLPSLFTAGNIAIGYYIIMQSIRGSMLDDSAAFDYAAIGLSLIHIYRRRGLAGELMDRAEAQAQEAGCAAVALHVFTGNATAIRFYERRGYIFSHRAASFYGRGTDALVYHKELPPISIGQRV